MIELADWVSWATVGTLGLAALALAFFVAGVCLGAGLVLAYGMSGEELDA